MNRSRLVGRKHKRRGPGWVSASLVCGVVEVSLCLSHVLRRNHWSGAKALAKFMKPKKENGRERIRSGPETSRPTSPTPDAPDGLSAPPPPPPRQPRLSLDSAEESHALPVSPAYVSKGTQSLHAEAGVRPYVFGVGLGLGNGMGILRL